MRFPRFTRRMRSELINLLGLVVGPFAFFSLWLIPAKCGRAVEWPFKWLSWAFLLEALVVGFYFLWQLPIRPITKAGATLLYVPVTAYLLFLYWLIVAEYVFGISII